VGVSQGCLRCCSLGVRPVEAWGGSLLATAESGRPPDTTEPTHAHTAHMQARTSARTRTYTRTHAHTHARMYACKHALTQTRRGRALSAQIWSMPRPWHASSSCNASATPPTDNTNSIWRISEFSDVNLLSAPSKTSGVIIKGISRKQRRRLPRRWCQPNFAIVCFVLFSGKRTSRSKQSLISSF
jgi:hypothetical protein